MSDTTFALAFYFIAILEVGYAAYILIADRKAWPNRGLAGLFILFAVASIDYANLLTARLYQPAFPWLILFVAVTYMVGPAIYLASVMALRPAWLRHRWIYIPVAALAALPALATLLDVTGLLRGLTTTPLLFSPPSPQDYPGGLVTLAETTGGYLRPLFSALQVGLPTLALICPMLVVAIRDFKKNRSNSQIAWIFVASTMLATFFQVDFANLFKNSTSTLLTNLTFFLGFAIGSQRVENISYGFARIRDTLNDWSIFAKLVLVVVTVVIPTIIFSAAISTNILRANLIDQAGSNLQGLLEVVAGEFADVFVSEITNLNRLSDGPTIVASLNLRNATYEGLSDDEITAQLAEVESSLSDATDRDEAINRIMVGNSSALSDLRDFRGNFPDTLSLLITDRYGALLTATTTPSRYSFVTASWWASALALPAPGGVFVSSPRQDLASGRTFAQIVIPIPDPGAPDQILGYLSAEYSIDDILTDIAGTHEGDGGHIDLFGPSGILIHSGSTHPEVGTETFVNWARLVGNEGAPLLVTYGGEDSIVAWTILGQNATGTAAAGMDWRLTVHQDTETALQAIDAGVRLSGLATIITILAALGLTGVLAGFISRPLIELTQVAASFGEGDFSIQANADRKDEIGTLGTAFNTMAGQLNSVVANLEQQVSSRTAALERQTRQLQAATQVGQAASSILVVEDLIQNTVEVIRDRFGLYYVGLFLTDVDREYAVLRAGTGSAGQIMLARGHRLRIGDGMVGWSILHGQSRITQEAGADTIRMASAELPDTRSEAALPLRARGQVIGALSVQSTHPDEFSPTTLGILQSMTDQVAIAIDNANLLAENQKALADSQRALETVRRTYQQVSREAWNTTARQSDFRAMATAPGVTAPDEPRSRKSRSKNADLELSVLLKIRDHPAGVIRLQKPKDAKGWNQDEVNLIEAFTSQVGLALESARLFQDTQLRTVQLQTSAEVSSAASSILNLDELLNTAVNLIGDRFALYYAGVFLVDEAGTWAVLRSGTGEAGRIQIEQNHRLELGGRSMIGQCIATGKARIAMDVGEEAVRFENPRLPDTRTEMALPLTSGGQTIGALTVQSTLPAAFTQDDISVFQTLADQLANAIQNARLYQQSQESTQNAIGQQRISEALVKSASRFSVAGDEDHVYQTILTEIEEQIHPDQINLLAWEEAENAFRVVRRYIPGGEEDTLVQGQLVSGEDRPDLWFVYSKNQAQYKPELRDDALTHEQYRLPWLLENQPIGVVEAYHTARGAHIGDQDRAIINGIIQQADVSLQSTRSARQTKEALARTNALFRVSQAAIGLESLPILLEGVVDTMAAAIPAERILLLTLDHEKRRTIYFIQNDAPHYALQHIPYEELLVGLTGWVLREGKTAISPKNIPDPRESHEVYERRIRARAGSIVVVPLNYRGRTFGTITASNDIDSRDFTEADAELMLAMANQTAVAIQSAQLLEETRKSAENQGFLNQISAQLIQSLDFDAILQSAVQEIGRLPEVKSVSLTVGTESTNGEHAG